MVHAASGGPAGPLLALGRGEAADIGDSDLQARVPAVGSDTSGRARSREAAAATGPGQAGAGACNERCAPHWRHPSRARARSW